MRFFEWLRPVAQKGKLSSLSKIFLSLATLLLMLVMVGALRDPRYQLAAYFLVTLAAGMEIASLMAGRMMLINVVWMAIFAGVALAYNPLKAEPPPENSEEWWKWVLFNMGVLVVFLCPYKNNAATDKRAIPSSGPGVSHRQKDGGLRTLEIILKSYCVLAPLLLGVAIVLSMEVPASNKALWDFTQTFSAAAFLFFLPFVGVVWEFLRSKLAPTQQEKDQEKFSRYLQALQKCKSVEEMDAMVKAGFRNFKEHSDN